tara:strand:+ start:111 stop:443 length:333 start_codon:yes stop_codon:yes gene_type:complete
MLKIGELDRRIIIESPTATTNSYGEKTNTWSTAYTLWAKIDWKKSNRKEESQELVQTSDLTFYIRNMDGITIKGTYRINYDSKYYYIHGIKQVDGRKQFLELETKLKDNN